MMMIMMMMLCYGYKITMVMLISDPSERCNALQLGYNCEIVRFLDLTPERLLFLCKTCVILSFCSVNKSLH